MKELLSALANVKKEVGTLSKTATNPFFKSKYFDINSLIEQIEPLMEKNGLLLLQPIEDGKVVSIIYHIETEMSINSEMLLPNLQDPQKIGSAITYYRRYTLQSLLGLQAEDDDGNKASKVENKQPHLLLIPKLNEKQFDKLINGTKEEIEKYILLISDGKIEVTQKQLLDLKNKVAVKKSYIQEPDPRATQEIS